MAVDTYLQRAGGNGASTTLSSSVSNSDTNFPLTSDTLFSASGGLVIIDEGAATEELIYYTSKSGSSLVAPLTNRGLEGGSAQAHAAGAGVKAILSAGQFNNIVASLGQLITAADGTVKSSIALTTPKITTSINDANGNEIIKTPATTSAVNEITVTNAATGNAVQISATGGDTDIELKLASKGAKEINLSTGYYQGFQSYTPAGGATATLDLSLGNKHNITMPAGNITIALSNAQVGQCFLIRILQDGVGSRTVTWFTTIKWAGGSAPTLTTTASKADTFGFVVTSAGNYDGFVVGQSL